MGTLRISKAEMMMQIAHVVAQRSTCRRKQVGAVVTDLALTTIHTIAYNGAPRGEPNGCLTDLPGQCGCLHAEVNALVKAPYGAEQLALFTTLSPCLACARLLLNSSVTQVYYAENYRDSGGLALLKSRGVECHLVHVGYILDLSHL